MSQADDDAWIDALDIPARATLMAEVTGLPREAVLIAMQMAAEVGIMTPNRETRDLMNARRNATIEADLTPSGKSPGSRKS